MITAHTHNGRFRKDMQKIKRTSLACLLSGSSMIAGPVSSQSLFEVDTLRASCVTIESYPVAVDAGECRVVDFEWLTNVDGYSFYYARYRISTDVPIWPSLRDITQEANALVLFAGEEGSDHLRVYRTYHEDFADFRRFDFLVPEVMDISLGRILHLKLRGTGSGMSQWFNDEYWHWQWNDWQRLDVTSWYDDIGSYLPSTYRAGGVSPEFFDLTNLRNISPVRKIEDAQCCPSGGIVTVSFEWVDRTLVIREAVYDPHTDFRSLSR